MKEAKGKPRPRREPILIITHGDGSFDVHAENANVKIVACPYVGEAFPTALAEDFIEQSLPHFWRRLYFPNRIKARGNTRPVTPSKIAEAKAVGELLKCLNGMQTPQRGLT